MRYFIHKLNDILQYIQSNIIVLMEESSQIMVVLCDIEKLVDLKVLTQYLTTTKAMDSITKFTKSNDKFLIYFKSQKDA